MKPSRQPKQHMELYRSLSSQTHDLTDEQARRYRSMLLALLQECSEGVSSSQLSLSIGLDSELVRMLLVNEVSAGAVRVTYRGSEEFYRLHIRRLEPLDARPRGHSQSGYHGRSVRIVLGATVLACLTILGVLLVSHSREVSEPIGDAVDVLPYEAMVIPMVYTRVDSPYFGMSAAPGHLKVTVVPMSQHSAQPPLSLLSR